MRQSGIKHPSPKECEDTHGGSVKGKKIRNSGSTHDVEEGKHPAGSLSALGNFLAELSSFTAQIIYIYISVLVKRERERENDVSKNQKIDRKTIIIIIMKKDPQKGMEPQS